MSTSTTTAPRTPSVGDRAGARLHSYAHVQLVQQEARDEAAAVARASRLFRPHISDYARAAAVPRRPLYTPPQPAAALADALGSSAASGELRQPSAHMTPAQLRHFLARTAAFARQRDARLQTVKLLVAEEELKECTFRPAVGSSPPPAYAEKDTAVMVRGGDVQVGVAQWEVDLAAFEAAMEALRGELADVIARRGVS